jgi:two-component system NarL family sensor kinase
VKGLAVHFDPEIKESGYLETAQKDAKSRLALSLLAPQVACAILLISGLKQARNASISETELVREALRARDQERRRIAADLHDDLGQSMASLKLTLKWAEDAARRKPGMTEVAEELAVAREGVRTMLGRIRDLSHTLYPRTLDSLGLSFALKELAHQVSRRSAIKVECASRGKARALDKETGVALYRCVQEAISNVIRHAEASSLRILVRFGAKEVRVSVEDNGKGFNPRSLYYSDSKLTKSGFWTIRQRMADLGGAFRISTAGGRGTVVELIVPYSNKTHGKNRAIHRR